jgi:hypothetical protein
VRAAAAADGAVAAGHVAALRAHADAGSLLSDRVTVLQLDEYAGLGPADQRSFAAQLHDQLRGVPLESLRTMDGSATELPIAHHQPHEAFPSRARVRASSRSNGSSS